MRPPRGIDPALLRSQVDLLQPVDARRFVVSSVFVTALVTATRWPLRSHYLFSWDAANFAQALDSYNVAFHRPHPPGYPLYVGAAGDLIFRVVQVPAGTHEVVFKFEPMSVVAGLLVTLGVLVLCLVVLLADARAK